MILVETFTRTEADVALRAHELVFPPDLALHPAQFASTGLSCVD